MSNNILHALKRCIKREANYLFFRRYRFARVVRRHLMKYYSDDAPRATNTSRQIIFMSDGRRCHGGLADRLRCIATVYKYCQNHGVDFRINFTSPFMLDEYLEPNEYDWRINPSDISYNKADSHPVYMYTSGDKGEREMRFQRRVAEKLLRQPYRQLHVYSTFYYEDAHFADIFHHLFRPVPKVAQAVDEQLRQLGGDGKYVSISARFMELLGDFREPGKAKILSPDEQQALLDRCVAQVAEIRKREPSVERILVTSDSMRFLDACRRFDYVYVIPGEILHVDIHDNSKHDHHLKTFVDFFAIAHARKSYLLLTGDMYRSSFSMRASQIGRHDFEVVEF